MTDLNTVVNKSGLITCNSTVENIKRAQSLNVTVKIHSGATVFFGKQIISLNKRPELYAFLLKNNIESACFKFENSKRVYNNILKKLKEIGYSNVEGICYKKFESGLYSNMSIVSK